MDITCTIISTAAVHAFAINWSILRPRALLVSVSFTFAMISNVEFKLSWISSVRLERKKKKREETCQLNLGGEVLGISKRVIGSNHTVDPIAMNDGTTIEIEQEIEKSERTGERVAWKAGFGFLVR